MLVLNEQLLKRELAKCSNSKEVLASLAQDKDLYVRLAVAKNNNTSVETLARLTEDKNKKVRIKALDRLSHFKILELYRCEVCNYYTKDRPDCYDCHTRSCSYNTGFSEYPCIVTKKVVVDANEKFVFEFEEKPLYE